MWFFITFEFESLTQQKYYWQKKKNENRELIAAILKEEMDK